MIEVILEYFRMVGYSIVILSSLNGIKLKKFSGSLFVGDILVSLALLSLSLGAKFLGLDKACFMPYLLTPAVMVWASVHFWSMINK